MLWLLAPVFFDSLLAIAPSPASDWWPGWTPIPSIAFWYHFSLRTLPQERRRRQYPPLFLTYAVAILLNVLLAVTPWILENPRFGLGTFIKVFPHGPLYPLMAAYMVGASGLTAYNFWQARRATPSLALRKQFNSLVRGTIVAAFGTAYWVIAVALNLAAPTLPLILGMGIGVGWLGYGIVRYSALLEGRVVRNDFAFSGLIMLLVAAVYLAAMWAYNLAHGVPVIAAVFVVALAVATHSGLDFARRTLDRLYLQRPELALRAALRGAAADVAERQTMEASLRAALEAIVKAVDARWGGIALRQREDLVVAASINWKPVGERLPPGGLNVREMTVQPPGAADESFADLSVIAPLVADGDSVGVIVLAPPRSGPAYADHDLDLVAEAADHLAELIHRTRQQAARVGEIAAMLDAFRARERELQEKIEALNSPRGAGAVSADQVGEVEDALRRLYDYSYLGEHALAARLLRPDANPGAVTHLDRGKALNAALIGAIERLRPAGAQPREPSPREWHPYLVLHNAYLKGDPNRDIMARLYISEASFHRTRRQALRAVAKALFEMGSAHA